MTPSGVGPESLLQIYQTLLLWIAWLFTGLVCLGGLTFLLFLSCEYFPPPPRRTVHALRASRITPRFHPAADQVRFFLLPVVRIILTSRSRTASVGSE